ncbi:MAG: RnfABCDGE type electron transport complex subunit D [Clostridia bacterium]|nr:RnfABCDGE type electron transport complex subunit D [Clostridia bacterium]
MEQAKFVASSSPHVRGRQTVQSIMLDVCIALLPSALFALYRFGAYSWAVLFSCVAGSMITEWACNKLMKKPNSLKDLSAVVTGLMLGMCCPPTVPLWLPFVGGVFAIGIVKMPFGGLGHNFLNPALAARAFLLASWPSMMTTWSNAVDAVSGATPLEAYKLGQPAGYSDLLFGHVDGSIGEVCKIALLVGAAYLIIRKVINLNTPVGFVVGVAGFAWIFGGYGGLFTGDPLYALLSGGALMGAFFMCNDYTTSPCTPAGQFLMGLLAGILTGVIRRFGAYVEGVTYAILFLNVCTPLIDRYIRPKAFGEGKAK